MTDKIKFTFSNPLCFNYEIHMQRRCGLPCRKVGGFLNVALVVASKEIGLEVNADKTQYMVMSRDQNAE